MKTIQDIFYGKKVSQSYEFILETRGDILILGFWHRLWRLSVYLYHKPRMSMSPLVSNMNSYD